MRFFTRAIFVLGDEPVILLKSNEEQTRTLVKILAGKIVTKDKIDAFSRCSVI